MNELLLILVLLTDPASKPTADAIQQRIEDIAPQIDGKSKARVVIGRDAFEQLAAHGITDADLNAQPTIGDVLTKGDKQLAMIRIVRRDDGGNVSLESRVWFAGRHEQHVAISGTRLPATKPADGSPAAPAMLLEPTENAARGVVSILTPWLTGNTGNTQAELDRRLADLADGKAWRDIEQLTLPTTGKPLTPKMRYYRILALLRMERTAEAETALVEFTAAAPKHVLRTAAETLVHPPASSATGEVDINNAPIEDDGSNVLR